MNRRDSYHGRGQTRLAVIVLLVVVALGGLIAAAVLLFGPGSTPIVQKVPPTQQQIDDRLGALQQAFQSALQEERDLGRVASQARLFTQDHPDEPAGHMLLAQVQMRLNQWESSYTSWTRALELDPDVFEVHKMAGFCAAKLGRIKQAEAHYRGAIDLVGDRADHKVFASLGQLYLVLNDLDAAERAFKSAIDAPGTGKKTNWKHAGYAGLTDVAGQRGAYEKADELIDRAIKLSKVDSDADTVGYQIQKARLYMDAGRSDDALAVLTSLSNQNANAAMRIESAQLRARLYEQADDLERAVNHIATVCQLYQMQPDRKDDQLADFYALLARWQIKAGRYDAARTSIANLNMLQPEHP